MEIGGEVDRREASLIRQALTRRFTTLEFTKYDYWELNYDRLISFKPKRKEVPLQIKFLKSGIKVYKYSDYWNRRLGVKSKAEFGSIASKIVREIIGEKTVRVEESRKRTDYLIVEQEERRCHMCGNPFEVMPNDPDDYCSKACKQEFRRTVR